ncbi:hypothetical protein QYF36_026780 [Acer negundo]|nr:hypothetical protein QYF36_026780 [Acer negundo]
MLKHKRHNDDLKTVRGLVPLENRPWHVVDWVMIPCNLGRNHWVLASVNHTQGKIYLLDPFKQEVTWEYRNKQAMCLRWFIPSMLHQVRGNCGAHTLRLAEYLLVNKKEFDWKEEDMGTIREKIAVEVYCNSLHNTVI